MYYVNNYIFILGIDLKISHVKISMVHLYIGAIPMEKQKSNLLTNLKKATIEMMLLKLLSEEDMYGYQLSQELKKRSNGNYTILEGSMYPILYRLSDQQHISFFEKKVGKRQTRVYYHLEPSGYQYLEELKQSFTNYIRMIDFLLASEKGDSYESKDEEKN